MLHPKAGLAASKVVGMRESLQSVIGSGRLLVAAAATKEALAVARALGCGEMPQAWRPMAVSPAVDVVLTGVSKANAAGAVGHALAQGGYGAVLNLGVAGALPRAGTRLALGAVVGAAECVFADEGLESGTCFQDCSEMGFPLGDIRGSRVPVSGALIQAMRPVVNEVGPIATVSTCSGTDA